VADKDKGFQWRIVDHLDDPNKMITEGIHEMMGRAMSEHFAESKPQAISALTSLMAAAALAHWRSFFPENAPTSQDESKPEILVKTEAYYRALPLELRRAFFEAITNTAEVIMRGFGIIGLSENAPMEFMMTLMTMERSMALVTFEEFDAVNWREQIPPDMEKPGDDNND
jgi:hypothetical protein